jgi:hypothetical protein
MGILDRRRVARNDAIRLRHSAGLFQSFVTWSTSRWLLFEYL